jgi:hypothetical protein
MRAAGLLAAAAVSIAGTAGAQQGPTVRHATGRFEVKLTPEAKAPAASGGMATGRTALAKTFTGGMAGTATGTMLSAGTPGDAMAYVAIDQFRGTVDGKAGGFLLLHRGTMTRAGGGDLSIVIAPDTGTGALAGIAGTLTIEVKGGVHTYDLAYTLPQ